MVGDAEWRAIRQQPPGRGDRDLAQRQRFPIQGQRTEPPGLGAQIAAGLPDQGFEITILLLEMLGAQEHPLGPYDLAVPAHGGVARFIALWEII